MLRNTAAAILCLLSFVFVTSTAAAGLFGIGSYSADVVTTTSHGTFTAKVFFKDNKQRMEMAKAGSGFTIFRYDKKVAWTVMPEQKMYMELDLSAMKQDMQNNLYDPDVRTEKEFMGSETVDGHPAKKYHVTIIKQGKKETGGFLWEATDLNNFPVKYQSEDGKTTTVWKNIKRGPIADSLFEVPSGYKKMELNIPGMGRMKIPGR